ncbi:MAG: response regulator [Myxococcota bacterium]|nr:response regulator [Myxococcota bacterium]
MRPTGVTIIDRAIGGFPPGMPLLLKSAPGADRTELALALAHHALARGEGVRFLTPEPPASLLRQGRSLGFDLETALEDGRFGLFELHGDAPALLRDHGIGALIDALRADLDRPALIVVDPVSSLVAEIPRGPQLREVTRAFARALADCDVVLTVDSDGVASQPGLEEALAEISGACFPQPRAATRRSDTASEGAARAKVLVVEDDRLQREMLHDWLAPHYEVVCAADGFEAFSMLVADPPDLVVLDLVMPRVSGYELLQSLRRAGFEMPVLVTSSRVATAGERLGPLVLGATEFLAKPMSRVELLHKVATLLRLPRSGVRSRFGDSQAEAEALFGNFSNSRLLETGNFADRVGRACDFGRKVGLSSSLIGLAADSAAALDHWVEVANRHLRYEDAILRADKSVAVLLLVATEPRYGARVLERLRIAAGEPLPSIETQCWLAAPEHARPGEIEALIEPLLHPSEAAT